jgi:DNA-binding XRE family transcriptional regulator
LLLFFRKKGLVFLVVRYMLKCYTHIGEVGRLHHCRGQRPERHGNMADRVRKAVREYAADARDHAIAMRDVATGAPVLTENELDAFLAAPSPLPFWRKRAGMTQTALARKAGITQAFLAQIETGSRDGTVAVLKRISDVLGLRIEDLIPD